MELNNVSNLSVKNIEELCKFQVPELEIKLSQLCNSQNFGKDLKGGGLIDCFVNIFQFCKENSFSVVLTSWLVQLQATLLGNCEQGMSLDHNLEHLLQSINSMVVQLGTQYKDGGLDTKVILNFMMRSFFQHYDLYKFMFTMEQENITLKKTIEVETVPSKQPFPAPLEEAILESLYEEYLNAKPIEEDVTETSSQELMSEPSNANQKISPEDNMKTFLSTMKPDDLKNLIREIADNRFSSIKTELEGKITERESALTKTFNKLQPR